MKTSRADASTKEIARSWLQFRGLEERVADFLPENGVVVSDENGPVAMGFIRRVEGNHGLIDGYITDPLAPADVRNEALDLLTSELIELAKSMKVYALLGFSKDIFTLVRSERFGFKRLPETMIRIDLSGV